MTFLTDQLQRELRDVAFAAADAAKAVTLSYFRSPALEAENKDADGFDPVTRADREAELAIREVIQRARPEDGILGEELPTVVGTSGLTWVLDPIDGTRGFISGTPTWGTLISVATISGPVFGLIDQPFIGERFIGGFGIAEVRGPHGTYPLQARGSRQLDTATMLSTFPEIGSKAEFNAFRALSERVRLTRYGMDCYGYALLAAGQVDLVVEAGLNAYDIQAPICVIQAAGGIVSNWQGGAAYNGGRVIAAANADIHAVALSILQDAIDD